MTGALITVAHRRASSGAPREHDAADHVLSREDAHGLRLVVHERHRADAARPPSVRSASASGVVRAARRPAFAAAGCQAASRVRRRSVDARRRTPPAALHPREVEQMRELPRAEVLEHRRARQQRVEDCRRKREAERVSAPPGTTLVTPRRASSAPRAETSRPAKRSHGADAALRPPGARRGPCPVGSRSNARAVRAPARGSFRPARSTAAPTRDDALEIAVAHRRERRVRLQRQLHSGQDRRCGDR